MLYLHTLQCFHHSASSLVWIPFKQNLTDDCFSGFTHVSLVVGSIPTVQATQDVRVQREEDLRISERRSALQNFHRRGFRGMTVLGQTEEGVVLDAVLPEAFARIPGSHLVFDGFSVVSGDSVTQQFDYEDFLFETQLPDFGESKRVGFLELLKHTDTVLIHSYVHHHVF